MTPARCPRAWRHLDFGRWQVQLRAGLRRGCCPTHGVRVEAVPFARAGTGFSRDLPGPGGLLGDQDRQDHASPGSPGSTGTPWGGSARGWSPTGSTPSGSTGWCASGPVEVSWKRHHHYLTLVADHTTKKIVWGAEGKDTATLDAFLSGGAAVRDTASAAQR